MSHRTLYNPRVIEIVESEITWYTVPLCGWSVLLFLFYQGKQKQMHRALYLLMSWTLLVARELNLQCIPIQDRPLINFLLKWMGKYMDSEGAESAWLTGILNIWVNFSSFTTLMFFVIFCNAFKGGNFRCFYDHFLVLPTVALMALL